MERYVFFDTDRLPSGLPVIRVPTPNGFAWVEITAAEYEAVVTHPELAHQLASHVQEVLASQWQKRKGYRV